MDSYDRSDLNDVHKDVSYIPVQDEHQFVEAKQHNEAEYFTFDEALDKIGFGFYQIVLMQLCGFGWLFDGLEIALISFIVPELTIIWKLSPIEAGALGSAVYAGMMFGAFFGGFISDQYGRKLVFVWSIGFTAVFGLLSGFADSYGMFLVLRVMVGFGLGASIPTDYSLFMEYIPRKNRGTVMVTMNIYWVIGNAFECLLGYLCMTKIGKREPLGWKYLVIFSSLPGFIVFFLRLFVHESPRYLLSKHQRLDEVTKIVQSIAYYNKTSKDMPHGMLIYPSGEYKEMNVLDQIKGMLSRQYAFTTVVLCIIWFLLSYGAWGFNFLLPIVMEKQEGSSVYLHFLIVICMGFFGNLLAMLIMDRVGRRYLLLFFLITSGVATCLVGASNNKIVFLIFSCATSFLKTFAWDAIYTYTPEVYPTSIRTTALGTCSAFTRLAGVVTSMFGEQLYTLGYWIPFLTFGLALIVGGLLAITLPYETLGAELQDVIGETKENMPVKSKITLRPQKSVEQPLLKEDRVY